MIAGLTVSLAEKEVMIMSDIAASLTQIQSDIARAQESAPQAAPHVILWLYRNNSLMRDRGRLCRWSQAIW